MRILVVGGGGREHALAWKLAQSPQVEEVIVAPGNGGTVWPAQRHPHRAAARRAPVPAEDVPGLVRLAREERVDLVVAGPEAPLVAGLADACREAGLAVFGPVRAAARLEGSKAFAKRFMEAHGIPTARAGIYEDYGEALAAVRAHGAPVVVKADGLAAGKGVTVCSTVEEAEAALRAAMLERRFGDAGRVVLVEDCLEGTEATLLAFCDGRTVLPMIPAQDYKRAQDGDAGPNTGGMGSYAPAATLTAAQVEEIRRTILQPAVDGLWKAGTPYVGVLYAGLMLTAEGPKVLEFNCRFGDPEAQAILPLLETDLAEVLWACVEGRLHEVRLQWRPGGCVCVVLASPGYPGSYPKGLPISGLEEAAADPQVALFHAGTERKDGAWVTAGGRVLGVTAWDASVAAARERAYRAVAKVRFPGMHYRRDIALDAARRPATYASAGVDIERKAGLLGRVRQAVEGTYTEAVVAGMGAFGGVYDLAPVLREARAPLLVASTDGVGTKTKLAAALGRYRGLGHDLVNHCVNDILVQGARPLFFLDYFASSRLEPRVVEEVILGCAEACRAVGCALLGGETAEMPDVYAPGEFDLVGTIVGWVEREALVDGREVVPGDVCVGLASSGLHTNGYSLARKVLAGEPLEVPHPALGIPLGDALLEPHRCYLGWLERIWAAGVQVKAMAHITGGGLPDNLPRALPSGVRAVLRRGAWPVPPLFRLIQKAGPVDEAEMFHVFNMGIGMVLVVPRDQADAAVRAAPGEAWAIGEIAPVAAGKPPVEFA